MCTCPHGCPVGPVSHVGFDNWPTKYRFSYKPDGTGNHGNPRAVTFAADFYDHVCKPIFKDMDAYARWVGGTSLAWIGDVGATVCKPGMHGLGRAFDISRIQMHRWAVDCNTSWRPDRPLSERRRYVAVAATCRSRTGTVLTTWYNSAHTNHIHIDNGVPFTRIRPGMRSDTTLIQAASNLLIDAGLVVDGDWGPRTDAAYHALRSRFRLGGQDPRNNAHHARNLLVHIAVAGFAG